MALPKSDSGQNCCSSAQRPLFSLCSFPFHLALAFAFVETAVGAVICISTRFPPVFRPMSRCATVVTCVCVHIPRAREIQQLTFSFARTLALSERVHFHAVGVARIVRVISRGSQIAFGTAPLQQRVSKRGAVGECTLFPSLISLLSSLFHLSFSSVFAHLQEWCRFVDTTTCSCLVNERERGSRRAMSRS